MSKVRVAVLTGKGCRMLVNPHEKDYIDQVHVVNPDVSHLCGVAPEDMGIADGKLYCLPGDTHGPTEDLPRYADLISYVRVLRSELEGQGAVCSLREAGSKKSLVALSDSARSSRYETESLRTSLTALTLRTATLEESHKKLSVSLLITCVVIVIKCLHG